MTSDRFCRFEIAPIAVVLWAFSFAASAVLAAGPLDGSWAIVSVGGKPADAGTLMIADGRVSGRAPCNGYRGTVDVDGDKIKFGPLAATRMMCAGKMDDEAAFLAALQSAVTFKATSTSLAIIASDGSVAALFKK